MQAFPLPRAVSRRRPVRLTAPRPDRSKATAAVASGRAGGHLEQIAQLEQENAELRRAKEVAEAANEAKTRYLVSITHEIRSPLNTIYGYAQLLERDDSLPGTEAGAVIRRSAEHLTNLVEGLLEISRIEGGVIKIRSDEIDIRRLLDHIIEMFRMQAASKGLTLALELDPRLPECVRTDEKKLRQILINLVSNAVKYTQTGGVTIAVGYRSQVADIQVRDTGIGIAAEDLDKVFEPFERGGLAEARRQPGIGLGLAITRVLANVLGGDLAVTSKVGAGSNFRLRVMLPALAMAPGDVAQSDRITGYQGTRRTVLVVDDDPTQSTILKSLLRPLGFAVHVAANGAEGIALAAECRPDIALLDIQMPGINGWEVAGALRAAHDRALKIVMVSANAHEFRAGGDGDSSHDAFATKPIDLDALLTLIGHQLGLHWDKAKAAEPVEAPQPQQPLPPEAEAFLERLRHLAKVGHVRGIEEALDAFAAEIPAADPLVAALRNRLTDLDLRTLSKMLDDAR